MWLLFRLIFIIFFAYGGWTSNSSSANLSPWSSIAWSSIVFVFGAAIGMRYWVLRDYIKKSRSEKCFLPAWNISPFQQRQPFQFFHLSGISFVAYALLGIMHLGTDYGVGRVPSTQISAGSFGIGILIGIYWATRSYRTLFVSASRN